MFHVAIAVKTSGGGDRSIQPIILFIDYSNLKMNQSWRLLIKATRQNMPFRSLWALSPCNGVTCIAVLTTRVDGESCYESWALTRNDHNSSYWRWKIFSDWGERVRWPHQKSDSSFNFQLTSSLKVNIGRFGNQCSINGALHTAKCCQKP